MAVLRISGSVDALSDFTATLMDLNTVYNRLWRLSTATQRFPGPSYSWLWIGPYPVPRVTPPEKVRLRIKSVGYGSPGNINLEGSGEILEALRKIINDFDPQARRRRDLENRLLEIQIVREATSALREMGYTDEEVRAIMAKEFGGPISRLLGPASKRIAARAEIVEKDDDGERPHNTEPPGSD